MVSDDPRSNTCKNLRYLRKVTNLDNAEDYSAWRIRSALPVKKVPEMETWRLGLMNTLMEVKSDKYMMVQDSKRICAMLYRLCST